MIIVSLLLTLYGCAPVPIEPAPLIDIKTFYNPQTVIRTARSMTFNYSGILAATEADGYSHCALKGEINNRNQATLMVICNLEYVAFAPNSFVYVDYDIATVKGLEQVILVKPLTRNYGICLKQSRLCSTQEKVEVPIAWADLQTIITANQKGENTNSLEVTIIGPLNEVTVIVPEKIVNQMMVWLENSL